MKRQQRLLFCVSVVSSLGALASDRITVIVPPAGQEAAEELANSLASACNNGDYIALMDHFTPAHRRRCHRHMEDMFVKGRPKMEIQQVTLLSEESDRFTFAVKYAWHDKDAPEQVYASKVTARLLNGDWKLDGETVRAVTRAGDASRYGSDTAVPNAIPPGWEPFNPPAHLINPNLEHLRGDIGIRPGRGCANGQCGK
jgi:hypothetical protein